MLSKDWYMAYQLKKHWKHETTENIEFCPLLADLNSLLNYLDEIGLKPGYNIPKCPACGADHRWDFIKAMLTNALELKPVHPSVLLEYVDRKLDYLREQEGGEEGRLKIDQKQDEFFLSLRKDKR